MKITIVYQRPLRGMSRNFYPTMPIDAVREIRQEGLNGIDVKSVTEPTGVFRLPATGELEIEVTPNNMKWVHTAMQGRVREDGTTVEPEWRLKYEEQREYVEQFIPKDDLVKEKAEEAVFTPADDKAAEAAPKKKRPGRPRKATTKPKAEKAAPSGDDG